MSTGVLLVAIAGLVIGTEHRHLVDHGVLGGVSIWSLVASLVFSGSTLGWLVFADSAAIALIALAALAIHEVSTERVVHTLEVRDETRELQTA